MANRWRKRYSTSLIKTTVSYHFTSVRMTVIKKINVGEDVEKREPLYTVGRNVSWYSHYGKQYWIFLKNLKIGPPYDPEIPLLGGIQSRGKQDSKEI